MEIRYGKCPEWMWDQGKGSEIWEDTFYRTGFDDVWVSHRKRIDTTDCERKCRLVKTIDLESGGFLIIESLVGESAVLSRLQHLYKQNDMVSIDDITDLGVKYQFRFERKYFENIKMDKLLVNEYQFPISTQLKDVEISASKVKLFRQYEEKYFQKEFGKRLTESTFNILNEKRILLKFTWKRLHYVLDGYSVDETASELDDPLHVFCPAKGQSMFDPFSK